MPEYPSAKNSLELGKVACDREEVGIISADRVRREETVGLRLASYKKIHESVKRVYIHDVRCSEEATYGGRRNQQTGHRCRRTIGTSDGDRI